MPPVAPSRRCCALLALRESPVSPRWVLVSPSILTTCNVAVPLTRRTPVPFFLHQARVPKGADQVLLNLSTREGSTIGACRHHHLHPSTNLVLVVAKRFAQEPFYAVPHMRSFMNFGGNGNTESGAGLGIARRADEEHEVGAVNSATGVLDSEELGAFEEARLFGERVRSHKNQASVKRPLIAGKHNRKGMEHQNTDIPSPLPAVTQHLLHRDDDTSGITRLHSASGAYL